MDTGSRSIIATTTVNFDQPLDVCRKSFYHYYAMLEFHEKKSEDGSWTNLDSIKV